MDLFQAYEHFRSNYPTMSAGSILLLGTLIGWGAGWLFFRQQMATLRERNDHLKEALEGKFPPHLASRLLRAPQKMGRRGLTMGIGITAIGLLIAVFGLVLITREYSSTPVSPAAAPDPTKGEPSSGKNNSRSKRIAQLQKFYVDGGNLLRILPKDISPDDFKKYEDECNAWLSETVKWIQENMGDAAKARFLDTSDALTFSSTAAVSQVHNNIINAITKYRKNLQVLIAEFDAWDSKKLN